mgnify:CR=1 FL=1
MYILCLHKVGINNNVEEEQLQLGYFIKTHLRPTASLLNI